ncbi:hypothetical protein EON81_07280 [bacterium]|nr:MAG: hypothetical protein EON81_07280 [bacterium]
MEIEERVKRLEMLVARMDGAGMANFATLMLLVEELKHHVTPDLGEKVRNTVRDAILDLHFPSDAPRHFEDSFSEGMLNQAKRIDDHLSG